MTTLAAGLKVPLRVQLELIRVLDDEGNVVHPEWEPRIAPGELRHDPAFWFIAAAARSATAPGIVPAAVMYAENRGWFGYAE